MLTGFNTDFKYKGVIYHVQTEDNGRNNPIIVTLLYKGGAILASRKVSYADILKFDRLEKIVRELMEQQHKQVIKDLVAGKFGDEKARGGDKAEPATEAASEAMDAEIIEDASDPAAKKRDGRGKSLDEFILDYLASEEGQ